MLDKRVFSIVPAIGLLSLSSAGFAQNAPGDAIADAVLGQADFSGGAANAGGGPTATTLNEPRGLAIDAASGRLFVSDSFNHRVLSWPSASAFTNGQAADIVFGQPDFSSNSINQGALAPTAKTLNAPKSVAVDSAGRLYIADSLNFRILRYDPPLSTNMAAVAVFGQAGSFTTANQGNVATADNLGNPDGIAIDANDKLYCADRFLSRVTIYSTPLTSASADLVIGQPNLTTSGGNLTQSGLDHCTGVAFDASGNLFVGDEFNNRALRFPAPLANNKPADLVFGQPNFTSNTANNGGISASTLNYSGSSAAVAVNTADGFFYVSDALNNRVLEYVDPPNTSVAARVFGQPNFTTATANTGGRSASTLQDPAGVAVDTAGNVYVSDRLNHRVLRYNAARADLSVVATPSPASVILGSKITVTLTVTNNGPDTATNVQLTDDLVTGMSFDSATASQGSCNGTDPVTCSLGSLAAGASATVTLVVVSGPGNTASLNSSVSATQLDPTTGNNSATVTVPITIPSNNGNGDNSNTGNNNNTNSGSSNDADGDGVSDASDNCPNTANADQADADNNGVGDACEGEAPLPQPCGLCGSGVAGAAVALMPLFFLKRRRLVDWACRPNRVS